MGKRLYVDGNIVINTPYFICSDMGAGSGIPNDAETIKTNEIINGCPCLVIDDDRPQSMFNEYYATGEVSSGFVCRSYLYYDYEDCYIVYNEAIHRIEVALNEVNTLSESCCTILYKSLYINLITVLDSFLCSIILVRILGDEEMFKKYYEKQIPQHVQKNLQRYLINEEKAMWEQQYVIEVLKGSYCNVNTIKDIFKLFGWHIPSIERLKEHFHCRHVLVHRNGLKRDDSIIQIGESVNKELIIDLNLFVNEVMKHVK